MTGYAPVPCGRFGVCRSPSRRRLHQAGNPGRRARPLLLGPGRRIGPPRSRPAAAAYERDTRNCARIRTDLPVPGLRGRRRPSARRKVIAASALTGDELWHSIPKLSYTDPDHRRAGWPRQQLAHHRMAAGDAVAIERLSRYEYRVLPLTQQDGESQLPSTAGLRAV
jgi:hypothetical protein